MPVSLKIKKLKIALYYDWLNQWGGAERLLLDLLSAFPQADLYTSVVDPSTISWLPPKTKVYSSFLNRFSFFRHNSPLSALFQPLALEQFRFDAYDVVISLTSLQGKCLLTPPSTLFLCYCLTPNRYLYQQRHLLQPFFNFYQKIDYIYSQRPDHYLAISATVQKRIQKAYGRDSTILYPAVDTDFFKPLNISNLTLEIGNYYLVVSRLVPHKRVDLAIRAAIITNCQLVIIGSGRQSQSLKDLASDHANIHFLNQVNDQDLKKYYQHCRALICPQKEDFGLVALEAQACGRPVIAYGRAGFTETIKPGQTGLFFNHQTVESLVDTINDFTHYSFKSTDCRRQALKFSRSHFMLHSNRLINLLWHRFQSHPTIT